MKYISCVAIFLLLVSCTQEIPAKQESNPTVSSEETEEVQERETTNTLTEEEVPEQWDEEKLHEELSDKEIYEKKWNTFIFETLSEDTIEIIPLQHASAIMKWGDEVVYADPVEPTWNYDDPTIIFVSHEHGDHFSNEILSNLNLERVTLLTTQTVYDKLAEELQEKATIMNNGDSISKNGFSITAIPAYNIREEALDFHPEWRGNGYIFEKDGHRVYFSGDSEDTPEMRALEDIDIAFVSMNLPYTMWATAAASAVNEFKPKVVFPYHYRGKEDLTDLEKFKRLVEEENTETEVIFANWY